MYQKDKTKALAVYAAITKKVNSKKWPCMIEDCDETAINSHLHQRNGILNTIAEENHFIQIKPNDFFKIEDSGLINFKRIGINDTISYPLFCNKHDTDIFKSIETVPIAFDSYQSQLLFSYRSLCAELRKKQKNIEVGKEILNSNTLNGIYNRNFFEKNEMVMQGNLMAINDLQFFKKAFEEELLLHNDRFVFYSLRFPLVKLSVSAIFSYAKKPTGRYHAPTDPLNTIFINLIPQKNELIIIVGYHIDKTDVWVQEYVESWRNCKNEALASQLSDLVVRIETWAIAISLYESIPKHTWERFKKKFIDSINNDSLKLRFKDDIFSSVAIGQS